MSSTPCGHSPLTTLAGLPPIRLVERKSDTPVLLHEELAQQIRAHLPPILRESTRWKLLYSLDQHGISLETMFLAAQAHSGPNLLVIKAGASANNNNNPLFGAFVSEEVKRRKGYYGNGDCFLWKQFDSISNLKVFHSTGANDYHVLCEQGAEIAFGGGSGGSFGLWLDNQLDNGHTDTCPTFDNEPLCEAKRFTCIGVELWGFEL